MEEANKCRHLRVADDPKKGLYTRVEGRKSGESEGKECSRQEPEGQASDRLLYTIFVVAMLLVAVIGVITSLCSGSLDLDVLFPPDCPNGMWPCEISHACINSSLVCNQIFDCVDKSDELSPELCDRFHIDLIHETVKKRPDQDRHKEDRVCTLLEVPEECVCQNSTNVYCRDKNLLQVPRNIPQNVTVLDLSGNNLTTLKENDLGSLPHLKNLLIIHSKVVTVEAGALFNCSSLTYVHLTHNLLTSIPGRAFAENNQLKELNLVSNNIARITKASLGTFPVLEELDLTDNNISDIEVEAFSKVPRLQRLYLSKNKLQTIKAVFFTDLKYLETLILNENGIVFIQPRSFANLKHLKSLSLDYNYLYHIWVDTFSGLANLTHLRLFNSRVGTIDTEAFASLPNVRSLYLNGNHLRDLTNKTFRHMRQLQYIYLDRFYQCIHVPKHVQCEPRGDGISSQYNLLENIVLRVCVWVVAILACVGNVLVFFGRFVLREDNQIHSFFIKNLSLADLLMGVYLLVIGAHDIKFRGKYLLYDEAWRNSWECDVSGILSTTSTEMSVLTLCIITLDRYISIMYPLTLRKRGLRMAYCAMASTWTISLALAVLPVFGLDYFGTSFYRDNGVCVPLHLHEPRTRGWEYSSFLFLGVNFVSFAFIAYAYTAMFWSIHRSAVPLRTSRESRERCLVKRFFFIVITDFLCWVPIIIIKVIALAGVAINGALYAWVVVFILPVNSALNPLLYTLTTKLFKKKLFSTFTSVVWRPSVVKNGSKSSRASLRANSSVTRKVLQDSELELLRRHGGYRNGSNRDKDVSITSMTPLGTSSPTSRISFNAGPSPTNTERKSNCGSTISGDF